MRGSVTVFAIVFLFFFTALAAGAFVLVRAGFFLTSTVSDEDDEIQEYHEVVIQIIQLMKNDSNTRADCRFDSYMQPDRQVSRDFLVRINDVSSRINPNFIEENLFTETDLDSLFLPGVTAQNLQDFRDERGLSLEIREHYQHIFTETAFADYLTPYGYANINCTDEFVLEDLYYLRTGDEQGADLFHAAVQNMRASLQLFSEDDLPIILGGNYEVLANIIHTEPVWNIHFLPEEILSAVLNYGPFEIEGPLQRADRIQVHSATVGIDPSMLRTLVGAHSGSRIYAYLGTITWFWKIEVEGNAGTYECIVARLPGDQDDPTFQIISNRWAEE
ncbi:MAG: hypothetical protein ACLFR1_11160 [Spirochaetia bacterium]